MIKKKHKNSSHQQYVTWTGYGLFALIFAGLAITTIIPFAGLLANPRVLHMNVLITLLSFTVGVLLPFIVAYVIGDKAARSKNKRLHHYDGVMFGLLAYWLALLFGQIGYYASVVLPLDMSWQLGLVFSQFWPVLATAAVSLFIAVHYHRKRATKNGVLDCTLFSRVFLVAAALVSVLLPLLVALTSSQISAMSFVSPVAALVLFALSYIALKSVPRSRVNLAAIGSTIFVIASFAVAQVLPLPAEYNQTVSTVYALIGIILAVAVWVLYLRITVKDLRK